MGFSQPQEGEWFKAADYNGRLLLIYPLEMRRGIPTVHGEKDGVESDVVVLDTNPPEVYNNSILWGKVLVPQLKSAIGTGEGVLGRLRQGEARRGQNPPWQLAPYTAEEAALAEKWEQENKKGDAPAPSSQPAPNGIPQAMVDQLRSHGVEVTPDMSLETVKLLLKTYG